MRSRVRVSVRKRRERIDLKLGVAAVTAGRKPLLQFGPYALVKS